MTAAAFCQWLDQMGYSDREAERRLGVTRKTIGGYRQKGAPLAIALACAALSNGLSPYPAPLSPTAMG
jgi:hypothetical protein